jgi:hypothetical protein
MRENIQNSYRQEAMEVSEKGSPYKGDQNQGLIKEPVH